MKIELYTREVKFDELKGVIEGILVEVDQGKHDEALSKVGVNRSADDKIVQGLTIEQKQYLTPEEWLQIIIVFGPTAGHIAKDVWDIIVVPKLKRLFRDDQVQALPPSKNDKKS